MVGLSRFFVVSLIVSCFSRRQIAPSAFRGGSWAHTIELWPHSGDTLAAVKTLGLYRTYKTYMSYNGLPRQRKRYQIDRHSCRDLRVVRKTRAEDVSSAVFRALPASLDTWSGIGVYSGESVKSNPRVLEHSFQEEVSCYQKD